MADKLTLIDILLSPFAIRVRIALREKGLEFESVQENLGPSMNNKSQLLLKMNPVQKKVPVLIHNGKPVCESAIILQYIDEVWREKAPLLPSDPYDRARARFWTGWYDEKMYGAGKRVLFEAAGEVQEAATKEIVECFKLLEAELNDKPYFGGNTFGFLDVSIIAFHSWFYCLETCGGFSLSHECPKLVSWAKRCIERESVSRSLPDQREFNDAITEGKKRLQGDQHKS